MEILSSCFKDQIVFLCQNINILFILYCNFEEYNILLMVLPALCSFAVADIPETKHTCVSYFLE